MSAHRTQKHSHRSPLDTHTRTTVDATSKHMFNIWLPSHPRRAKSSSSSRRVGGTPRRTSCRPSRDSQAIVPSICLSVYLSIYLSIYVSVCGSEPSLGSFPLRCEWRALCCAVLCCGEREGRREGGPPPAGTCSVGGFFGSKRGKWRQ